MNIVAQCCALAILFLIMHFSLKHSKLILNTGKAYIHLIIGTIICVVLDIASIIAINVYIENPNLLLEIICKSYLCSIVSMIFFSFRYIYSDLFSKTVIKNPLSKYYNVILIVGIATISFCRIDYHLERDNNIVFTEGPAVLLTYYFCGSLLVTLVFLMIHHRKVITPQRLKSVSLWLAIWVIAAFIQFFNNSLLLVGFAGALGILIIYLILENPDGKLDSDTGLYNARTMVEYLKELFYKRKKCYTITIITDVNNDGFNGFKTLNLAAQTEFLTFLENISGSISFLNSFGDVCLVFTDKAEYKKSMQEIDERFLSGWGDLDNIISPYILCLSSEDFMDDRDCNNLFSCYKYARENIIVQKDKLIEYGSAQIDKFKYAISVEQNLYNAIENDWIQVYFQPIYSIKDKAFTSAEALVRFVDKDGKIYPPFDFIVAAEKNGLIIKLGEIIFRKVCCFLEKNIVQKLGVHYIEINLSVVQCAYKQLANDFISIMKEYGIKPYQINLEITESASVGAKNTLLENMKKLIEYGCSFSLDDFGTGQSNLNYIAEMPVEIVKFDRDMTKSYFISNKSKYIMNAAIHMIKGMKLKIVSEGIEEMDQYEEIKSQVDYIQGYYFSKPLPEDKYIEFMRNEFNKIKNLNQVNIGFANETNELAAT